MKHDYYTADGYSEASGKLVANASEPSESQSWRSWLGNIAGVVASATAVILLVAYIALLVAYVLALPFSCGEIAVFGVMVWRFIAWDERE